MRETYISSQPCRSIASEIPMCSSEGRVMDLRANAELLRQAAFDRLVADQNIAAFAALDCAVQEMGGTPHREGSWLTAAMANRSSRVAPYRGSKRRISQTDAAAFALRNHNSPVRPADLLDAARALGARFKSANPLPSFVSSLSRDNRFRSTRVNGRYYWELV